MLTVAHSLTTTGGPQRVPMNICLVPLCAIFLIKRLSWPATWQALYQGSLP